MNWREYKTLIVLCFFTLFFSAVTIGVAWIRPNDGTTFTAFLGLTTSFAGSILKDLPGGKNAPVPPPPGSTTVSHVEQVVKTPPDPPKESTG